MDAGEYSNSGNVDNSAAATDARPVSGEAVPFQEDIGEPPSADEMRLLLKLGIGKPTLAEAVLKARKNGTTIERELIADGTLEPRIFYEALADWLDLPFFGVINPSNVVLTETINTQLAHGPLLRLSRPSLPSVLVLAPEAQHAMRLRDQLGASPHMREGLAIAAPQTIREAIWKANCRPRIDRVTGHLFGNAPAFSARVVLTGWQGYVLGALSVGFPLAAFTWPEPVMLLLHLVLSIVYLLAIGLRAAALRLGARDGGELPPAPVTDSGAPLPVYTVLVAAYREEAVVAQMIAALDALDWPKSLLDIKIVCEADDRATIEAVRHHVTGAQYEIVEVPAGGPRTKPKALDYALAGARGDYVVIFDAEDRPHPRQLREAHARFSGAPDTLACVQAPLNISNAKESRIAALFALEYAALFRSLLPLLARLGLPMPLGGTSNHFRGIR